MRRFVWHLQEETQISVNLLESDPGMNFLPQDRDLEPLVNFNVEKWISINVFYFKKRRAEASETKYMH